MIIIYGQSPYSNNKYYCLGDGAGVYRCGQTLNIELMLTSGNTKATYLTISDGTNSITSLEMLKTTDNGYSVEVLNVAPFVRSFFDLPTQESQVNFKEITITATNENESDLTYSFYAFLGVSQRGGTPQIARATEMTTIASGYTAVTRAELLLNVSDTLYVPAISGIRHIYYNYQTTGGVLTKTISTGTSIGSVEVKKGSEVMCTKNVVQLPYCDNTIVLKYLNQRGEFEFFVFDNHYDIDNDVTKGDRIYNQIDNPYNIYENGEIGEVEYSKKMTADTILLDSTMLQKALDLLVSKRVYMLFNATSPNVNRNWREVDIEMNGTINTKKNFNKLSVTITQEINVL